MMIRQLFALLAIFCAISGCSSGTQAQSNAEGRRPALAIGVNTGSPTWWNQNRIYANLILGNHWQMALKDKGWQSMPPELITADGWLRPLPPGAIAFRSLNHPNFTKGYAEIICRYTGKGDLAALWHGSITEQVAGRNNVRFRWRTQPPSNDRVTIDNIYLQVTNIDAADPIRDIDCRETTMDPKIRFYPPYVASLRGFKVIRYLALMNQTTTPVLTWAGRKKVTNSSQITDDGMAIEDLVALANAAQVSPWFTLPYHADDDYQRRFASYVHENLDPGLVAHVELGNEVWNSVFYAQFERLQREGITRGLSPKNNYEALLRRYAQRTTEIMKIWTAVYKDRPRSLVRIAATQAAFVDTSNMVLGFEDTAKWVDALAIAPYFSFDKVKYPLNGDMAKIFAGMNESIETALGYVDKHRAIADRYGVRLIAYEGGQHIVLPDNIPLLKALNRDPRMETAYRRYIDGWATRTGDMMVLMQDVAPIGRHGAWGLREYVGQPLSDAPKARAALAYLPAANIASK
jgi:hypothetical protein